MHTIRGATSADVLAACHMMWESYLDVKDQVTPEFFQRYQFSDPSFEPEQIRVLWKDGRIAAVTRVFLREVFDGSEYQIMAGIGNVATHPDFRGKGLSIPILEDSLEYGRGKGANFSMLYTEHRGLYEKVGFETKPRIALSGEVRGTHASVASDWGIDRAKALYAKSIGRHPGAFVRSDEYWERWIRKSKLQEAEVVYSNRMDAYAIYAKRDGLIDIIDGGYDVDPGLLGSLVASVFSGRSVRLSDVDENHALVSALKSVLVNVRFEPFSLLMVTQLGDRAMPSKFCETPVDHF